MLQGFRDNLKGVTAFILVILLIIPLAFFGVESLFVSGSSVEEAATVNGEKITLLEVDRGVEFQKQRILSQFEDLDPSLLDDERLKGPVLDQLIRQKLLTVTATESGMAVSDNSFNEIILGNDAFRTEGNFDEALYQYHLSRLGFTPLSYRQSVKEELLANHLSLGLQATSFNTAEQLADFGRLALQERSFDYISLNQKTVTDIDVSADEIESYYNERKDDLTVPDKVVVEYIELTPQLIESQIEVDEGEVDKRLKARRTEEVVGGKSWRLAHILIDSGDDQAQQKIEAIQQKLAGGEAFAELAKQYSADFGSAESGGELGTFTVDSLPPGFRSVVETLKAGDVSNPAEMESGTHFIQVLDASTTDMEQVQISREQIVDELRAELADEQLPTVLAKLKEESFSVDVLSKVGELLELPVKISAPFTKDGGSGIARYPAVVDAAYSDDVMTEGFASEVLELEENHYMVVKLKEFIASHLPTVDEVSDQIRDSLRIQKAQAVVQAQGEEILSGLESGGRLVELAGAAGLSVSSESGVTRFDQRVPPALSEAIFRPPMSSSLPVHGLATTLNGDVLVYALKEIKPGVAEALSGEERRAMRTSLAQLSGLREYEAYLDALESEAEITRQIVTPEE